MSSAISHADSLVAKRAIRSYHHSALDATDECNVGLLT